MLEYRTGPSLPRPARGSRRRARMLDAMDDADPARWDARRQHAADRSIDIALNAYGLKDQVRAGWVLRGVSAPESVAAHSWGTALLCLMFATDAGVDGGRAVAIATVHDLAEAEIGDIPARADAAERELGVSDKARLEAAALTRMLGGDLAGLYALWREYEDGTSAEARFARDMNLLDMALQAVLYEEQARYEPAAAITSRGDHGPLDEFFASADARVQGTLARHLLERIRVRYRHARRRSR